MSLSFPLMDEVLFLSTISLKSGGVGGGLGSVLYLSQVLRSPYFVLLSINAS